MNSTNYIPGTCNIGPSEIKKRKAIFYITALLCLCLSGYCIISLKPLISISFFLLFIMLIASAINYQQFKNKFCLMYGWLGLFNLDKGKQTVVEKEFIKADRKLVLVILYKSVLVALIFTFGVYLISTFFA